ncbi:hypothetical protein DLAC_07392 [Tieghemostelium lacteum]|uniref:Cyclin N-terminal domain-containing protein n=1 Tax=Tieghemostelium lacteum TaxID=361077 RepID=A0A151ZCF8_TIELA|nr:hypothetical protein DLAC_07392 [Tieghemostelium lacteum]|eukprot:KYQ91621.1 hypothetical protein DLAC_07392 [Tieghemostelium lacteum]
MDQQQLYQQQQQHQHQQRSHAYQRMFRKLLHNRSLVQKPLVQERIVASYKIYSWLIQHDPAYKHTAFRREVLVAIDEIFDIVLAILDMMKCSSNLLLPVIIYADRFVARSGIKHNQLFNLLLTSSVVSLKFWSESTQVNNAIIADIFNFSLKDMNLMERRFLTGVDYNLFLTNTHVSNYLLELYDHQNEFFTLFKQPFENAPQFLQKPIELIQYEQQLHQIYQLQIKIQQQKFIEEQQQLQHHHQQQYQNSQSNYSDAMVITQMVSPMC